MTTKTDDQNLRVAREISVRVSGDSMPLSYGEGSIADAHRYYSQEVVDELKEQNETLAQFMRDLLTLDGADEESVTARREVTLTRILLRAREVAAGAGIDLKSASS